MQKTRKMLSLLLAVLMLLSMCTVGMMSVSALPQDAVINDTEGADASGIDGDVLGLMGDTDANDTINVKDATQIQKFAAKLIELDETSQALADVNLDEKVNVKDATAIQKWVAKYDVEEPINCLVYVPTQATVPTTVATEPTTIVTVPTTEATENVPTTATQDETTPSIPVIVIPTTVATEPTEAPATTAEPTEAPATTVKPTEAPVTTEATTAATTAASTDAPADDVTIYFQNNWMWGDVCFYAWGDDGAIAEWPGEAMTLVENDGNYDIYSFVVPQGVNGFLINGTKDTAPDTRDQTPDIEEWTDGQCFYMVWNSELNEGAGGNDVGSFPYVVPTEPATTTAAATTAADTTAAGTTAADTTAADTTAADTTAADTTVVDDGMITVYFTNNKGWAAAYIYGFYGVVGEAATGEPLGKYPGTEMTYVRDNQYGQKIYSADIPADIDYIKFCDGNTADNHRTDNIPASEFVDGTGFYLLDKGEKYWPYETYEYDVPADDTTVAGTTAADTTAADTTAKDTTVAGTTVGDTTVADDTITIYFTNNKGWEGAYIYGFYGVVGETATGEPLGKYPGVAMTYVRDNQYGQKIYSAEIPADIDYIKFSDGTSTNNRTDNIPASEFVDGTGFYLLDKGEKYWPYETYDYDVPVDDTTVADTTVADTTVADTTVADTTVADTTVADTTVADTTVADTTVADTTVADTTVADDGTITIYFTNNKGWEKVYVYAFYGEVGGTATGRPLGDYPGTEMTFVRENQYGQDIFSIEIPADVDYIKFSDNSADNNRTDNIANAEFGDGIGFYLLDKGDKYWPYETYKYDVPVDDTTAADTTVADTTAKDTTVADTTVADTTVAPTTVAPTTEPKPTEPAGIKVYAINSAKWDAVCAYYWGGVTTPTWPGKAMTKTGETVNGFDVYEFTFETAPQNIIFNNNDKGSQTADLTFQAGQYFDVKGGKWYKSLDDVPAVSASSTDRYLVGSFNGWSTTANEFLSADGKIGRVEMDLAANTTYEFKVVREGTWTSCKDTLSITNSATGLTFSSSVSGNTKLTTKNAGTYVFEFDLSASQLTVTYP